MCQQKFSHPGALRGIQNGLSTAALEPGADPKRKQLFDDLSLRGDCCFRAASAASRILHGQMKGRGPGFVLQRRIAAGSEEGSHRAGTPRANRAVQRSGTVLILGVDIRASLEQKLDGLHLLLGIPTRRIEATIRSIV